MPDPRYDYPLTPDSIVFDCGGYKGEFAANILARYGCRRVVVFEPISEFFQAIGRALGQWRSKVEIVHAAVGGRERRELFHIQNDSTGIFAGSPTTEECLVVDIADVLEGVPSVDLIKLNIEGMEFEVLERVLELGIGHKLNNIQVQFHPVVPECEERHRKIHHGLLATHHLTFDAGWVWSNYALND